MWVGFEWIPAFANIAIRYRCFNPSYLTRKFFCICLFSWLKDIGLVGRGYFLCRSRVLVNSIFWGILIRLLSFKRVLSYMMKFIMFLGNFTKKKGKLKVHFKF
jgi:hypothetical protein